MNPIPSKIYFWVSARDDNREPCKTNYMLSYDKLGQEEWGPLSQFVSAYGAPSRLYDENYYHLRTGEIILGQTIIFNLTPQFVDYIIAKYAP